MPTYEYSCTDCGHDFERFERITSRPNHACPKCKKKTARRKISGGGGLIFKGSGFYCTDYRSSAYAASSKKDGPKTESPKTETAKKEPAAAPATAKTAGN